MNTIDASRLEPGDTCPCDGCAGSLDTAPTVNCSCHIAPPCSACERAGLICDTCGWDSTPEAEEPERYAPRRAEQGSRRSDFTRTHTANPWNSTPFTDCCGVAAIGEGRCPHCEAQIIGHDDGLASLRREVGPGNCLMCRKPRAKCYC